MLLYDEKIHISPKYLCFILTYCVDLKTLIQEESAKEECYKFKKTGHCPFEESCYRSHYTREQLQAFQRQRKRQRF